MDYKITITISPFQRDLIISGLKGCANDWHESAESYATMERPNKRMVKICLKNADLCRETIDEVYAGSVEQV
ncbi:hypothetical protein K0A96_00020 [Patescibacteria group bacterium]|nr:hypothetical protein [Patescibacteria group bacterium]